MKARITCTFEIEYDINLESYPFCTSYEEALAKDLEQFREDYDAFFELASTLVEKVTFKGELEL